MSELIGTILAAAIPLAVVVGFLLLVGLPGPTKP